MAAYLIFLYRYLPAYLSRLSSLVSMFQATELSLNLSVTVVDRPNNH